MKRYGIEIMWAICQLIYFIFFKLFISNRNLILIPITSREVVLLVGAYGFLMLVFCLCSKWHLAKHGI